MVKLIDGTEIPEDIYETVVLNQNNDVSKMNFDEFHKAFTKMFNDWCGIINDINDKVNKDW